VFENIRHLEELQFVSAIRENFRLYSFDSGGGGALKIVKTWRRASKIYQYPQQGPCKNMSFFQDIFIPPPPPLGIVNVLSLSYQITSRYYIQANVYYKYIPTLRGQKLKFHHLQHWFAHFYEIWIDSTLQ
jgi:hypothetical protein